MSGPAGYLTFETFTLPGGPPQQDPHLYVCAECADSPMGYFDQFSIPVEQRVRDDGKHEGSLYAVPVGPGRGYDFGKDAPIHCGYDDNPTRTTCNTPIA